jgi:carboxymethylenebutenolidase
MIVNSVVITQTTSIEMRITMKMPISLTILLFLSTSVAADIAINPTTSDQLPPAILGHGATLQGQDLHYFDQNKNTRGYLAVPSAGEKQGAVILIHEWNGLTDRVREVADNFAAEGYVALAADLYAGRTGSNRDENMALVRESYANQEAMIQNLEAAVSYLKNRADVNGKVATIGWCYGGGVALSYALGSSNHEGTAIFYGRLLDDPEKLKSIHHEILGTFAGLDKSITRTQVDNFVKALRVAGIPNDVHIYDAVQHGFWLHVDRDPETNSQPALHAWNRLKAYLNRTLQ